MKRRSYGRISLLVDITENGETIEGFGARFSPVQTYESLEQQFSMMKFCERAAKAFDSGWDF